MLKSCIFCRIIKRELPSHTVYEDEYTLAFLDSNPIQKGHTLVIPKKHIQFIHHANDEIYHNVMSTTKKIMLAIESSLSPPRVGVIVEGFDVDHAHVKVTPLYSPSDIRITSKPNVSEKDLTETAALLRLHV